MFRSLSLLALSVCAGCTGFGTMPERKIRVACIGDSITWGQAMTNRVVECCPAQPQRLSGEACPTVRFGVVADLHSADIVLPADARIVPSTRFYREARQRLETAVGVFNRVGLDFAIELGDFKDLSTDKATTLRCLDDAERTFAAFKGPRYHVLGNHDFDCLTPEEFMSHVTNGGRPMTRGYYSFEVKGVRFIVLDGCYESNGRHYSNSNPWDDANIPADELSWLERELAATSGKAVVFCHQRLDTASAPRHDVRNAADVRRVLEKSGKVAAVVTGHDHRGGSSVINGIPYYSLSALVCGKGPFAVLSVGTDGSFSVAGWRGAADWP